MSENEKQIVTYTKNGKEETKILKWYNKKFILRSVFNYRKGGYQAASGIDFVHLKNCELQDLFVLNGPKNGEVIFENCTFKRDPEVLGPTDMVIRGNKVKLLNPKLVGFNTMRVENGKVVEVTFDKNYRRKMVSLDVIDSDSVFIEDNNAIGQLNVEDAIEVRLVGNFDVDSFSVSGDKVSIVGEKDNMINFSTGYSPITIIGNKMLELKNCKLTSKNSAYFKFKDVVLGNCVLNVEQLGINFKTDKKRNYRIDGETKFPTTEDFIGFLDEPSNEISFSHRNSGEKSFGYKKKNANNLLEDATILEETLEDPKEKITTNKKR